MKDTDLRPMRGILYGLGLSLILWAVLVAVAVVVVGTWAP